jgi:putrescine transport system permease protein
MVFIPAVGEFVIPDLLGGGGVPMIGRRIWDDFGPNQDWPMASTVAVVMVLLLIMPIMIFHHHGRRERESGP